MSKNSTTPASDEPLVDLNILQTHELRALVKRNLGIWPRLSATNQQLREALWNKDVSKIAANIIDVYREYLSEFVVTWKQQLSIHCNGNCFDHEDAIVLSCYRRHGGRMAKRKITKRTLRLIDDIEIRHILTIAMGSLEDVYINPNPGDVLLANLTSVTTTVQKSFADADLDVLDNSPYFREGILTFIKELQQFVKGEDISPQWPPGNPVLGSATEETQPEEKEEPVPPIKRAGTTDSPVAAPTPPPAPPAPPAVAVIPEPPAVPNAAPAAARPVAVKRATPLGVRKLTRTLEPTGPTAPQDIPTAEVAPTEAAPANPSTETLPEVETAVVPPDDQRWLMQMLATIQEQQARLTAKVAAIGETLSILVEQHVENKQQHETTQQAVANLCAAHVSVHELLTGVGNGVLVLVNQLGPNEGEAWVTLNSIPTMEEAGYKVPSEE